MESSRKINLISLGCPKNLVDSEVMLGELARAGYAYTQDPEEAEVLLVNTCGFIQDAVKEAIDRIFDMVRIKEQFPGKKVVVTGCAVQRYGKDLQAVLSEVDLFIGTEAVGDIAAHINNLFADGGEPEKLIQPSDLYLMNSDSNRLLSAPYHSAYIKVTEGCANRCAYCLIPSIRGRLRSRAIEDIITEASRLADKGVKEIILVAQDLTAYGIDLGYGKNGLVRLLEALLHNCSMPWIRLLYLYPIKVTDELLKLIKDEERILSYLDIPLQHVSSRVLASMNRPYGREQIDNLIARIRNYLPHACLRTTFMVGFPGEKEEDIDQLAEFMETYRFQHVGIFAYSNEEECTAARLSDHCETKVKQARRKRLLGLQKKISHAINRSMVGKDVQVLVEGASKESDLLLEGRTWFQSPDIDGCIYLTSGSTAVGEFVTVLITDAHPYDLVGEIISAT